MKKILAWQHFFMLNKNLSFRTPISCHSEHLSVKTCSFANYSFIFGSIQMKVMPTDPPWFGAGRKIVFWRIKCKIKIFLCQHLLDLSQNDVIPNKCLSEHVRLLSTPTILAQFKWKLNLLIHLNMREVLRQFFNRSDKK